jgi:hypothetical protein
VGPSPGLWRALHGEGASPKLSRAYAVTAAARGEAEVAQRQPQAVVGEVELQGDLVEAVNAFRTALELPLE